MGRLPDDFDVLELALKLGVNPREIRETWDCRDVARLHMVIAAKREAREALARQHKVPIWTVPEF